MLSTYPRKYANITDKSSAAGIMALAELPNAGLLDHTALKPMQQLSLLNAVDASSEGKQSNAAVAARPALIYCWDHYLVPWHRFYSPWP